MKLKKGTTVKIKDGKHDFAAFIGKEGTVKSVDNNEVTVLFPVGEETARVQKSVPIDIIEVIEVVNTVDTLVKIVRYLYGFIKRVFKIGK